MSTCYSLIRRDARTAYELGKASFLRHVFGSESVVWRSDAASPSLRVTQGDVDTLGSLMLAAERGDLDACVDVSIHRRPDAEEEHHGYWREVASDVVDWSEGQLFEFCSEHSWHYEALWMDDRTRDRDPLIKRLFSTGSLYTTSSPHHPGMEALARRRRVDESFRRGEVWIDRRSGVEFVRPSPRL